MISRLATAANADTSRWRHVRLLPMLMLATAMTSTVWWRLRVLPGPVVDQGPGVVPLAVADILAIVTVVTSLSAWIRHRRFPSPHPLGLSLPLGIVVWLALAGVPHAPDQLLALSVTAHLALLTLLYLTFTTGVVAPSALAAALGGGFLIQSPLAIEQVLRQTTSPLSFLLAWSGNYRANTPDASVLLGSDGVRWLRAYGPFDHPNILGGYLALELPLVIGVTLAIWPRLPSRFARICLGLPLGLILTGLALSASRAAWLGALAGLAMLAIGQRGRASRLSPRWFLDQWAAVGTVTLAVLTLTVALVLLRPPLWGRFAPAGNRLESTSVQERLFFNTVGLQLLAAHPYLGVGAGNVERAELRDFHRAFGPAPMHNVPLLMAVELGPGGALAWIIAAAVILVQSWRYPGRWTVVFGAALVAVGIAGFFDHYFWKFPVAGTTVAIVAGGWTAALNAEQQARLL